MTPQNETKATNLSETNPAPFITPQPKLIDSVRTQYGMNPSKPLLNSVKSRRMTQNVSKEDFHRELTDKLSDLVAQQSTMESTQKRRSRNLDSICSSSRKLYAEYARSPREDENPQKSVSDIASKIRSSSKKKSQTFDSNNQWKKEVEIDSLLHSGSSMNSAFGRLIDEYSAINDSGLKISASDSNLSYDSERRKKRYQEAQLQKQPSWTDPKYVEAICRLQKAYSKRNYFGDKNCLLNPDRSENQERIDYIMKDLTQNSNS